MQWLLVIVDVWKVRRNQISDEKVCIQIRTLDSC